LSIPFREARFVDVAAFGRSGSLDFVAALATEQKPIPARDGHRAKQGRRLAGLTVSVGRRE
jgi:hypothetical protein